MKSSLKIKEQQLGMSMGKANHKLRKMLIFHLAGKCNRLNCFRCKNSIDSIEEFSIDHIKPWMYASNSVELFFDLKNISFSHFYCNVTNIRREGLTKAQFDDLSKSDQLGMSFSTAYGLLRKSILYDLAKTCEMTTCVKCNNLIESMDDFSIEHIEPWLHSENPVELFFDLDNIAFSHHKCNVGSTRTSSVVSNKTNYKGVVYVTSEVNGNRFSKPYQAKIVVSGRTINLGRFATPEEAAYAYDEAAIKYQGDKAVTNVMLGLIEPREKRLQKILDSLDF